MIVRIHDLRLEQARRARRLLRRGEVRAALQAYDELVAADPDEPRWRSRRLDAVYSTVIGLPDRDRRFTEALRRIQSVVAECPADSLAHFEHGYASLILSGDGHPTSQRLREAEQEFSRARSLAPGNLGGWWGGIAVADWLRAQGVPTDADPVTLARASIRELPKDGRSQLLLAMALVSRGQPENFAQATLAVRTAVSIDEGLVEAWMLHAELMVRTEDHEEAIAAYARVISLDSESPLADEARRRMKWINDPDGADGDTVVTRKGPDEPEDEPDPPSPVSGRLPVPPFIPAFRAWPTLYVDGHRCRVIDFDSPWS